MHRLAGLRTERLVASALRVEQHRVERAAEDGQRRARLEDAACVDERFHVNDCSTPLRSGRPPRG